MSVPIVVESREAWGAIAAARRSDGLVLLIPRIDGQYARIGTVGRIEETGRLPDGREATVFRGLHRGLPRGAAIERDGALWMTVESAPDPELSELPGKVQALGKEYRAIAE